MEGVEMSPEKSPLRRVLMVPPDPRWAKQFADEAARIEAVLGACHVAAHHIGSTSIPGIYAKPVIDMLVEVTHIETIDERTRAIEALGYQGLGEFGLAGRRYFRKDNAQGIRSHHLHSYAHNNQEGQRHLAFRDFMRAHPTFAREYSDLKRRLATAYPYDIEAYMDGKDAFIKDMEQRALAWCSQGRASTLRRNGETDEE